MSPRRIHEGGVAVAVPDTNADGLTDIPSAAACPHATTRPGRSFGPFRTVFHVRSEETP